MPVVQNILQTAPNFSILIQRIARVVVFLNVTLETVIFMSMFVHVFYRVQWRNHSNVAKCFLR